MKTKNTSDYVIAAAVVACSVVLLAALTMALTGFRLTAGEKNVHIDFPSVAGIRVNSQVRYAGKRVGVIQAIDFLNPEQRLQNSQNIIRVTARLDRDTPPLYQGTAASIISDTVLAEKFVDLIPVSLDPAAPTPPMLGADDVIPGNKVVGFDDLTRSGYQTLGDVNKILSDLHHDYPDLHQKIGSLIYHSENLVKNADDLVSQINTMLKKHDPNLSKTVADLRVISQNLKVTTTYAKALTFTLGEKPWRLIWGGEPNVLPTEEQILASEKPLPAPAPPVQAAGKISNSKSKKSSKISGRNTN